MSQPQPAYRRAVAAVLVVVLALLVAPAAPAAADTMPLPGYSVDDPPAPRNPGVYTYRSANALAALAEPTHRELRDINVDANYPPGTRESLLKNWQIYQTERVPQLQQQGKTPLTWAQYRDTYIRTYNSNMRGRKVGRVRPGVAVFRQRRLALQQATAQQHG